MLEDWSPDYGLAYDRRDQGKYLAHHRFLT